MPIFFCTAYSDLAYKAFKNSGIDYILKPFKEQEIHNTIHKIETLKDSFSRHIFKSSNQKEMIANDIFEVQGKVANMKDFEVKWKA